MSIRPTMSRRRLSKQQHNRIVARQQEEIHNSSPGFAERQGCNGRVISHFGQQLEVETLQEGGNGRVLRCHQRSNLPPLVTGDFVLWEPDGEQTGVIVAAAPRDNVFARYSGGKLKPVAANIDTVLVVIAVLPEPFVNLIDRYLVAIESRELRAHLVLNKVDLQTEQREEIDKKLSIYQRLGYPVSRVSAKTGAGLGALKVALEGKTTLLVGQSGVGKSSLINRFGPVDLTDVGALSGGKYKGTHTTTTARLFHLQHCDLIDSPGIREFHLDQIDRDQLLNGFKEIQSAALQCRFRDCSHSGEPGCAIDAAIANGEIAAERVDSYFRILNTLDETAGN